MLTFTLGGLSKSAGLPQVKLGWIVVSGPAGEVDEAGHHVIWQAPRQDDPRHALEELVATRMRRSGEDEMEAGSFASHEWPRLGQRLEVLPPGRPAGMQDVLVGQPERPAGGGAQRVGVEEPVLDAVVHHVRLGREAGLSQKTLQAFRETREGDAALVGSEERLRGFGVRNVPNLLFGGRVLVPGTVNVDTYVLALDQALFPSSEEEAQEKPTLH